MNNLEFKQIVEIDDKNLIIKNIERMHTKN